MHFWACFFFYSSWFCLTRCWWKGWFGQILVKRWGFLENSRGSRVWFGLVCFMLQELLQAIQCQTLFMYILNLRFTNKYIVDNIPNAQLSVELYHHCSSIRMALALDNAQRLIYYKTKKPIYLEKFWSIKIVYFYLFFLLFNT